MEKCIPRSSTQTGCEFLTDRGGEGDSLDLRNIGRLGQRFSKRRGGVCRTLLRTMVSRKHTRHSEVSEPGSFKDKEEVNLQH